MFSIHSALLVASVKTVSGLGLLVRVKTPCMELPLREYDHTKVRSAIHYLTAVMSLRKKYLTKWNKYVVYNKGCVNNQNVHKWRREYLVGHSQLYNESSDSFVFENIQHIHTLLEEDWRYWLRKCVASYSRQIAVEHWFGILWRTFLYYKN